MADTNQRTGSQTAQTQQTQTLRVHYEEKSVLYGSQFVLNLGEDEVVVNFSSGMLPDASTGQAYLPIHTRVAMTHAGARKLAALLNQALGQAGQGRPRASASSASAKLPEMDSSAENKPAA